MELLHILLVSGVLTFLRLERQNESHNGARERDQSAATEGDETGHNGEDETFIVLADAASVSSRPRCLLRLALNYSDVCSVVLLSCMRVTCLRRDRIIRIIARLLRRVRIIGIDRRSVVFFRIFHCIRQPAAAVHAKCDPGPISGVINTRSASAHARILLRVLRACVRVTLSLRWLILPDSNLQYARGRTRASKDIQQGDKTAISSCEDQPDFKQEDFATVLQHHITAYIWPCEGPLPGTILDDAEVKRFLI